MNCRHKRTVVFQKGDRYLGLVPESGDWVFSSSSPSLPLAPEKTKISARKKISALELVLYIGNQCNFACKYCYSHDFRRKTVSQSMTIDLCKKIIRNSANLDCEDINVFFFGAEPFLERALIIEAIEYIESNNHFGRHFYFHTTTNGSLVNESDISWIKRYEVNVGVSFDGPPHIHNSNRVYHNGRGTYDDVMRGIETLKRHGVGPTGVLITAYDPNLLFDICNFVIEKEISSDIKIRPLFMEGKAGKNQYLKGGANKYAERFAREHLKVADLLVSNNRKPGSFKVVCDNLKSMVLNMVYDERPNYCMRSPCGANGDIITVNQDGDVVTCDKVFNFPEFGIICNLNESGKDTYLKTSLANSEMISMLSKRTVENIRGCKSCIYRIFCGGGCTLESYLKFGSLQREDVFCRYYKAMFEKLLWKIGEDLTYAVMLSFPECHVELKNS